MTNIHRSSFPIIAFLTLVVMTFLPDSAYAYLDPGTGSMILQLVIAGALGALFTLKNFFRNIKAFTSRALRGFAVKAKDS